MTPTVTLPNIVTTIRLPRAIADEVRTIARRDLESESVTLRRLIRLGLARDRRSAADKDGEAA